MISFAQPLPIGNAVKVLLAPSADAVKLRLLRKLADDFSGPDDPNAAVISEGLDRLVIDAASLVNGRPYYYRVYSFNGASWTAGETANVTPAASAEFIGPDPLVLVRERMEAGLKVEVSSGRISHANGYVPCLTAPPAFEGTHFPVVTVHLKNGAPAYRGIGEMIGGDYYGDDGEPMDGEGWEARYQIEIWGWVVNNADLRIALRQAIAKIVIGNLPVFEAAGMAEIEVSQSDLEDFESYGAPVYQTVCSFTCVAPMLVAAPGGSSIQDVTIDLVGA